MTRIYQQGSNNTLPPSMTSLQREQAAGPFADDLESRLAYRAFCAGCWVFAVACVALSVSL